MTVAFGFYNKQDLFRDVITDDTVPEINQAIQDSFMLNSRQTDEMMSLIVMPTTEYKVRYKLANNLQFQPLDEQENPVPVKVNGYYDVAFPLRGRGLAFGDDRVTRARMTVGEANRRTLETMTAYKRLLKAEVYAAGFTNVQYNYIDEEHGTIAVEPLANGDAVTYVKSDGTVATAQHYLAQASAIDDSNNPYTVAYNLLSNYPGNTGPYVSYISSSLVATTEALTALYKPQQDDVDYADDISLLRMNIDVNDPVTNNPMVGWGHRLIGKTGSGVYVVEDKTMPAGYMWTVALGADKPFAMRQYPEQALQGMLAEQFSFDGNHREMRTISYFGFGAWNRIAACVTRIGNGTYAIPTGYDVRLRG